MIFFTMHLQKIDILKNETVKLTKTAKKYVQYMMKKPYIKAAVDFDFRSQSKFCSIGSKTN